MPMLDYARGWGRIPRLHTVKTSADNEIDDDDDDDDNDDDDDQEATQTMTYNTRVTRN
jgi:hypothetical protein